MDADYHPGMEDECAKSAKYSRKKKRRSKFAAVVQKPKPTFEPAEKPFEDYLQEYYQLDSLVTGDKFKYRKVMPNDFGLSTDEVGTKISISLDHLFTCLFAPPLPPLSYSLSLSHSLSLAFSLFLLSLPDIRYSIVETRN